MKPQKKGCVYVFPDDDIETVSFTEKEMDLKRMQELELKEHNYLRSLHGCPPLIINDELNKIAQRYAEVLAKQKKMYHSKKEDRYMSDKPGQYVGENLHQKMSTKQISYELGEMSRGWYNEIKDYIFETG